jgi:hypothetical protein
MSKRTSRLCALLAVSAIGFGITAVSVSAETPYAQVGVRPGIRPGSGCEQQSVAGATDGAVPGASKATTSLPNLTGTYSGDDGALYYMQQSGSALWWAGLSIDPKVPLEIQWHRGLDFTHVFSGTIFCDGHIEGQWVDVPRGMALGSGTLNLAVDTATANIRQISSTGDFPVRLWRRITGGVNDLAVSRTATMDLFARYDNVLKNPNSQDSVPSRKSLHENLKPYRDQTVVFGHIITIHAAPLTANREAPHVNFATGNFGYKVRTTTGFCDDPGDGDFDFRLKAEVFEHDFATTGWGDRDNGPAIFKAKFQAASILPFPGQSVFKPSEGYLGLESIMYGRQGNCHDGFGAALLPGWADRAANSVLINGRPINGADPVPNPRPNQPCLYIQPCPFVDPSQELNNGIQLQRLLLSAIGEGTYVRITGVLILDCGHGLTSPCFDEMDNMPELRGNQNQEIHPIYSIDVINYPFRPEDADTVARQNLTGTWAGLDGSTYYLRQVGSKVWWLGLMRDRQPMQPGNHFPIIGAKQFAPAFSKGDPPCASVPAQCWSFATVFEGTITPGAGQSELIQGTWAGVPQSLSAGSIGDRVTFTVDPMHKMIQPQSMGTIFPPLTKMYEPEDTTPPKSTINAVSVPVPAQPSGARGPAGAVGGILAKTARQITINAMDQGSGVEGIWYRFYVQGTGQPPAYTFVAGPTVSFTITGTTGSYAVDFYATDNAGNDETPQHQIVSFQVAHP